MAVIVTRNPGEFRSRVEDWLAERPVENNVLVTVAAQELDGVFAWVEEDDAIRAAALRTPPHPLVTSALDARDADPLMAVLLEADPDLSGVTGPEPSALFMAEAWRARTGGSFSPRLEMALYALDEVVPPARPPTGGPRLADARERELLIAWTDAFMHESRASGRPADVAVDERMAEDRLFVWDDDGPVSMVGTSPPVAGVTRVSLVYTPPETRGHGYGSALVADVSRRMLAAGGERCVLYADLENETSNRIYRAIGYCRIGSAQDYEFER